MRQRLSHCPGFAGALALLACAAAAPGNAQSIQGLIVDNAGGAPVAGARIVVRSSVDLHRAESDSIGRFSMQLRREGTYRVEVSHGVYADMRALDVTVAAGQVLEVEVRLDATPMQGDTIVVVGTALDLYHEGSFEGALQRRERLPNYGFRRVVTQEDPELFHAGRVSEVLRWFPPAGCYTLIYDGRAVRTAGWQAGLMDSSSNIVEAVEFYRRYNDAPMSYRAEASTAPECGVIALWSRRTPPTASQRPLLRLAGTAAATVVLIVLLR